MFGYRTFLKLGELSDGSLEGILKEGHELISCAYRFSQNMDKNGKAQSDVKGGAIHISYPNIAPDEIIDWALKSDQYYDGTLIVYGVDDIPLEKIFFENATCISMKIKYTNAGTKYTYTELILQAQVMRVGNTSIINHWTE